MRAPHIIIVCTPPCYAIWQAVTLFTLQHPGYTAIQFEDCAETLRHQYGISFSDQLREPAARHEVQQEFDAFLDAGLDLLENLVVNGPFWTAADRQKVLARIPDHYRVSAWAPHNVALMDFISFNALHRSKDRQWPVQDLNRILSSFTPPRRAEGFRDVTSLPIPTDTTPVAA